MTQKICKKWKTYKNKEITCWKYLIKMVQKVLIKKVEVVFKEKIQEIYCFECLKVKIK